MQNHNFWLCLSRPFLPRYCISVYPHAGASLPKDDLLPSNTAGLRPDWAYSCPDIIRVYFCGTSDLQAEHIAPGSVRNVRNPFLPHHFHLCLSHPFSAPISHIGLSLYDVLFGIGTIIPGFVSAALGDIPDIRPCRFLFTHG